MAELQAVPFVIWCAIAGVFFLVTGISYRAYLAKKKSDPSF
ncbi:hypothetical protein [Candidatus Nitrosotenuis aquarius]|nr:hypothetical protein [Candidatus Nitrosotenuis aquarius]